MNNTPDSDHIQLQHSPTTPASHLIELRGHIIDSLTLPRVLDEIMDAEGDFVIHTITVGRKREDPSYASIEVIGKNSEHLEAIIARLQSYGAAPVDSPDAKIEAAPADGVFPDEFYATTNLRTQIKINGRWVPVSYPEMDCGIRVDGGSAETVPLSEVRKGDQIVVGYPGVRVIPLERPRTAVPGFAFMNSGISSERPKALLIHEIATEMRNIRERGERILVVAGPAIVHIGAAQLFERLIESGYVQVLFAGNALATHDIENVLFGTSLGVSLNQGSPLEHGHEHHVRAINTIRKAGSIRAAVDQGIIRRGIMHACISYGVQVVLAGSVRDDGPLPEVITDMIEAQQVMRKHIREGVGMVIMLSTMLHSIATGNLLPAEVTTVCVDINPAVVTKLADRGSFQARGIVMDAASFLNELLQELAT